MAFFGRHRSYTEKVLTARKRRRAAGKVFLVLLIVGFIRAFFLQSYKIDSTSMQPTLAHGDRIISFPLPVGAVTLFGKLPRITGLKRGELIVVAPDPIPTEGWWFSAWDSLARFFTLQRFSPAAARYGESSTAPGLYRVVGMPGDSIRRKGALYEIRPANEAAFSNEYMLSEVSYSLSGTSAVAQVGRGEGSEGARNLGQDEYFVACDDRSLLAGSQLWGPIGQSRIIGRVIAVCWPPRHIKIP
ncbi:MAG TPA: signal peptidase I [Rectinemataceae bacterium]|nr:signal peptidase I [Rectinemataceae bacterium]